ncbi:hypothetical protein BK120_30090 [Paenibacillus sp. FSL A5-0031]|uniref:C39 family peptidase n=1 Tax=Paenibacillus sp. FSL A5-0031 TaxID=1920420 RepID=UPI00096FEAD8|nr:C39 family peptidase [Paenibacillus sp. FSL A5-0031]OME75918.1 hypothetical protein BK120_30090 [Paenibacillus sp. FSL A5-0031]
MKKLHQRRIRTIAILAICIAIGWSISKNFSSSDTLTDIDQDMLPDLITSEEKLFIVFSGDQKQSEHETLEVAIANASKYEHSSIQNKNTSNVIWSNYKSYTVYQGDKLIHDFDNYVEAVTFSRTQLNARIVHNNTNSVLWTSEPAAAKSTRLDAPLIAQLPELERGCEVTTLAMLLQYANVRVDKMELAAQIRKDTTPYRKENGVVYFGSPYDGLIGDMMEDKEPWFAAVYHGPIAELAQSYLPDRILDMTGVEFTDILQPLQQGKPVWVITNTTFKQLPDSSFKTWQTPSGPVEITYKEHAVLLTGYDTEFIYFNDPLANKKDRKVSLIDFAQSWEQMGKQAITFY